MKCPGQDSRYWKSDAIFEAKCPKCGTAVEFFKDDSTRRCRTCGHRFVNPEMDFGCASYCKYAEQCLGSLSPELLAQKEDLFKERVAIEMKRRLKQNFKGIALAIRIARYAEEIGKEERGDLAPIITAAYLHSVGVAVSREILEGLAAGEGLVEEVCDLIQRLEHEDPPKSMNGKILRDAKQISDLEERLKHTPESLKDVSESLKHAFFTTAGRVLAEKTLSK